MSNLKPIMVELSKFAATMASFEANCWLFLPRCLTQYKFYWTIIPRAMLGAHIS